MLGISCTSCEAWIPFEKEGDPQMKLKPVFVFFLLAIVATSVATSCPVCYGETDANTASAVNAAIFSLLLVVGVVLSFFASLIFQLRKRMKVNTPNNSNEEL
jgi:hypothetical protein